MAYLTLLQIHCWIYNPVALIELSHCKSHSSLDSATWNLHDQLDVTSFSQLMFYCNVIMTGKITGKTESPVRPVVLLSDFSDLSSIYILINNQCSFIAQSINKLHWFSVFTLETRG